MFADYAISGLDRDRTDYTNAKNALADTARKIDMLYIDDFSRASRDELEWWRLAAHVRVAAGDAVLPVRPADAGRVDPAAQTAIDNIINRAD